MSIDPLKSNALPPSDAGRTGGAGAAQSARQTSPAQPAGSEAAAADRVELSDLSRALVEGAREADAVDASASGLPPERLKEILGRIESGFYDRADVRDQVARRAANDLGTE